MTFIDKCIAGQAKAEEIHEYVERWHKESTGTPLYPPISAYLGMTPVEYALWVENVDEPRKTASTKGGRMGEISPADGVKLENEIFIQAIVLSRKRDESVIPPGSYCYHRTKNGLARCPYLFFRPSMDEQESGYCAFLGKGDWMIEGGTMLLWDSCKECGIRFDEDSGPY